MHAILGFCLILGISLTLLPTANAAVTIPRPSDAQIKTQSLNRLQELRIENVKRLMEIDRALHAKLEMKAAQALVEDVEKLQRDRHEFVLRQDLLDRLIFVIDTKYNGGNFRDFLERALIEQAQIDAASDPRTGGQLWKFFKYASESIRRLPEQREDMVAFLEGYMKRSVSNPVPPEDYLSSRNYTNGSKSETGNPMSREEVGAYAERRLQQIKAAEAAAPAKPAAKAD